MFIVCLAKERWKYSPELGFSAVLAPLQVHLDRIYFVRKDQQEDLLQI